MNLTLTNPVHAVEPQDLAMEDFRKLFRLVASCHVSQDGKVMTYKFDTMSGAHSSLSTANSIIIENKLPLVAKVRSVLNGKEVVRMELRIVYTPKEVVATEPTMPVGYAEHQPSINLAGINEHLQHAFTGIIY